MRRSCLIAVAAAVTAASAPAAAVEPPRWHLGGNVGFVQLFGGPSGAGFGSGLHGTLSVNDAWNVLAAGDVSLHPRAKWTLASGGLGVGYVVDVDRWVPWAGVLAGPAAILSTSPNCGLAISAPCSAFRVSGELRFGVDYQLAKHLAVGLAGRYQLLLLGDVPWMTLAVQTRIEVTWGSVGRR